MWAPHYPNGLVHQKDDLLEKRCYVNILELGLTFLGKTARPIMGRQTHKEDMVDTKQF